MNFIVSKNKRHKNCRTTFNIISSHHRNTSPMIYCISTSCFCFIPYLQYDDLSRPKSNLELPHVELNSQSVSSCRNLRKKKKKLKMINFKLHTQTRQSGYVCIFSLPRKIAEISETALPLTFNYYDKYYSQHFGE